MSEMNDSTKRAIETAELKKRIGMMQTCYTIGYKTKGGYCYTLADSLLKEKGRDGCMFHFLSAAMSAMMQLEIEFEKYEFCLFKMEQLR